ncbi:hypothetical protein NQZ79_g246 [Umbelopsis isabellina]|nr:hypothetical protein NQZ79_g246 [Umbelopsis isabellina]
MVGRTSSVDVLPYHRYTVGILTLHCLHIHIGMADALFGPPAYFRPTVCCLGGSPVKSSTSEPTVPPSMALGVQSNILGQKKVAIAGGAAHLAAKECSILWAELFGQKA